MTMTMTMTMTWVARPPVKKETGIGAVAAITTLFRNISDVHSTHMKALRSNGERGTKSLEDGAKVPWFYGLRNL
ncbi:MAG: hypothetical protein RPU63_10975 [Candidatus Sedimenticola sp. (ex Thyasira tokunagai)]